MRWWAYTDKPGYAVIDYVIQDIFGKFIIQNDLCGVGINVDYLILFKYIFI